MGKRALLISLGVLGILGCSTPQSFALSRPPSTPERFFITQYTHPVYHPQTISPWNANCGPVSLAMAIRAFGREPDWAKQDLIRFIQDIRFEMTGSAESGTWTYPVQFPSAASSYGLSAKIVRGGADRILQELTLPGRLAVVNLNPTPAYNDMLTVRYDGGHFALITGYDGDTVYLNDPLAPGPLRISRSQLRRALSTPLGPGIPPYNGGIVLWSDS